MKRLLIILLLSICMDTFSQDKWTAEFRPNIDLTTEKIGETDLRKVGFGFEFAINYSFMEHFSAYAGWGWNQFKSDDPWDIERTTFEETGYTFGLQFIHPLGSSESISYLIRAGGIYNHVEVENESGNIIADSDHELGWEVGIGIQYEFGNAWFFRPQIGYRGLSSDFVIENERLDFDLNYFSLGLGIAKRF